MPVHHLLEQILDEYIVAAGLQSGQPLSRVLIQLERWQRDELLTATMPGLRSESGPRRQTFSPR